MHLGDFARDHGIALAAENCGAILQRPLHAMRRFIEHQGARLVRERLQPLAPGGAARRQKPFETKAVRRQPADRQRGDRRAGPWDGNDLDSGSRDRAHQIEARVADGGRARIADQSDRGARRRRSMISLAR